MASYGVHEVYLGDTIPIENLLLEFASLGDDDLLTIRISPAEPNDRLQKRFAEFSEFLMLHPETLVEFLAAIQEQLKKGRRRASALSALCTVRWQRQKTAGRYMKPLRNVYGTYLTRLALMLDSSLTPVLAAAPGWDDASDEQLRELLGRWKRQRRLNTR